MQVLRNVCIVYDDAAKVLLCSSHLFCLCRHGNARCPRAVCPTTCKEDCPAEPHCRGRGSSWTAARMGSHHQSHRGWSQMCASLSPCMPKRASSCMARCDVHVLGWMLQTRGTRCRTGRSSSHTRRRRRTGIRVGRRQQQAGGGERELQRAMGMQLSRT